VPHRAEQFFAVGISVMNKTSGLCVVRRVIISVLDGLCLPKHFVFCVIRVSS